MNNITYNTTTFAQQIGVSKTSISNYITILEDFGHIVARNSRQHRVFTEQDLEIVQSLITLNRNRGMRLKEAAQLVLNPDFNILNLPAVVTALPQVVNESKYEDLSRSMQLLATHVYGIEQQNAQLLELIQAQRLQNDLLMSQNDTLKQELGTMMNHLLEKANEPQAMPSRQLDRLEQQNSAIMSVLNRMQSGNSEQPPHLELEVAQQSQVKGLLAKLRNR